MIPSLLVGASTVAITPLVPLPLAGHANRLQPFESVASPLLLRALALECHGVRALIVSADLIWWGPEQIGPLRRRLNDKVGISSDHLLLHATHTHGSPQTSRRFRWSLGDCDPSYQAMLANAAENAATEAFAKLTPASIAMGRSTCDIGMHRRRMFDGEIRMMPNPNGPKDPEIIVVRFARADDGHDIASLVHFACHPTSSGEARVSADYPGTVTARTAAALDDDAIVLFLQGCAGDVRPAMIVGEEFYLGTEADAMRLGQQVASAASEALDSATHSASEPRLAGRRESVPIELRSGDVIELQIIVLEITDDLQLVALDAEPVGEYQRYVKARSPKALPIGYTNGMIGYLATDIQLQEGGYEAWGFVEHFQLSAPFASGTEAAVKAALDRLVSPGT